MIDRLFDVQLTFFLVIDGDEIVYHDYVNISVAVATPKVSLAMSLPYNIHEHFADWWQTFDLSLRLPH